MAKVLSSISGNLISAASAGFAPTNSADVSAIASAYQVVSATGTQLYAGTAHVTSINSAPISASRAGNAANASMATSAYYDGTGRLISSLPDSATVSSIASSYAPTFGLNDGKISSINGSALDTPTGSQVVTATGSSWIGSEIGISSINGSALSAKAAYSASRAAEDDFGASFRYDYAKQSALTSVSSTVANNSASWGQGGSVTSPSGTIVVMNDNEIEGTNSAVLTASAGDGFSSELTPVRNYIDYSWYRLYDGILPASGATLTLHTDPIWGSNVYFSGKKLDGTISLFDVSVSGGNGATSLTVDLGEIAREISAYATTYVAINGKMTAEKVGGIQVTGVGELAWKSAVDNVTNTVSSNSATWSQGGVDSATVSAIASSYAESAVSSKADSSSLNSYAKSADVSATISAVSSNSANWGAVPTSITAAPDPGNNSAWFDEYGVSAERQGIASSTLGARYLAIDSYPNTDDFSSVYITPSLLEFSNSASTATVDISSIQKWNSAVDTVSSNSASWTQGGVDSATVSAIASSYVESGVSSKADSSALSSYALSADVSGTVDLVSTQSANWGGSALALSAGPGVKLEKVGSTLVAGLDETVLWSGTVSTDACSTFTLSEYASHFDRLRFYGSSYANTPVMYECPAPINSTMPLSVTYVYYCASSDGSPSQCRQSNYTSTNGLVFNAASQRFVYGNDARYSAGNTTQGASIYKIVGINRTAGV